MSLALRQELSRDGYGASESGAILGENPYRGPIDVWLEKTGQRPHFEGNDATEWGHDEEVALRLWYARRSGFAIWQPSSSLFSGERPWMRATPDGIALVDPDASPSIPENWSHGFEAKRAGWRVAHRWGEPGTDEVPSEYLIQCQHSMYVTGLSRWDLVATIGGEPPVIYTINRDDVLIESIVSEIDTFRGYVDRGEEPLVDGTATWRAYLDAKYPWDKSDSYIESTEHIEFLAEQLHHLQSNHKAVESEIERVKNLLQEALGVAGGVKTSLGTITCKTRQGNPDPGAVIAALAQRYGIPQAEIDGLREACRFKSSRPVIPYWKRSK